MQKYAADSQHTGRQMNALIEQIYQTNRTEDAQGNVIDLFPTSIPYSEGVTLYNFIRTMKSAKTLEIGMAYGLSTLFICQALQDNNIGTHTAIDPFETKEWKSIGLLNIKRAGLEKYLRFYEEASHEILPKLLQQQERFDFIFIDGFHRFDYTMIDFFYSDALLVPGGYIMFDDATMPSVRKALAYILRNRKYRITTYFAEPPIPYRNLLFRLIKKIAQTPLDIMPILLLLGNSRYCIVEKIAGDDGSWNFYKSF